MIIRCKIDVTKIDKDKIFVGSKGKYIDITLLENRDGPDQYDNDFMVVQDIGKEARERGEKGPILGNGKFMGERPTGSNQAPAQEGRFATRQPPATNQDLDEDVPF